MTCKYEVRQRVVCIVDISNNEDWLHRVSNRPVLNGIYTIRDITIQYFRISPDWHYEELVSIRLKEIHNNPINCVLPNQQIDTYEVAFPACWFKPLEEKKAETKKTTDIDVFKQMLSPTNPEVVKETKKEDA